MTDDGKPFDQFAVNERLTGRKATYDESLYTTKLDLSKIDMSKVAAASKLAAEIEGTPSGGAGANDVENPEGLDEEDLHSGVLRTELDKAKSAAEGGAAAAAKPASSVAVTSKLNPEAKASTFNPSASPFVPSPTPTPPAAPSPGGKKPHSGGPRRYGGGKGGGYGGGGGGGGGGGCGYSAYDLTMRDREDLTESDLAAAFVDATRALEDAAATAVIAPTVQEEAKSAKRKAAKRATPGEAGTEPPKHDGSDAVATAAAAGARSPPRKAFPAARPVALLLGDGPSTESIVYPSVAAAARALFLAPSDVRKHLSDEGGALLLESFRLRYANESERAAAAAEDKRTAASEANAAAARPQDGVDVGQQETQPSASRVSQKQQAPGMDRGPAGARSTRSHTSVELDQWWASKRPVACIGRGPTKDKAETSSPPPRKKACEKKRTTGDSDRPAVASPVDDSSAKPTPKKKPSASRQVSDPASAQGAAAAAPSDGAVHSGPRSPSFSEQAFGPTDEVVLQVLSPACQELFDKAKARAGNERPNITIPDIAKVHGQEKMLQEIFKMSVPKMATGDFCAARLVPERRADDPDFVPALVGQRELVATRSIPKGTLIPWPSEYLRLDHETAADDFENMHKPCEFGLLRGSCVKLYWLWSTVNMYQTFLFVARSRACYLLRSLIFVCRFFSPRVGRSWHRVTTRSSRPRALRERLLRPGPHAKETSEGSAKRAVRTRERPLEPPVHLLDGPKGRAQGWGPVGGLRGPVLGSREAQPRGPRPRERLRGVSSWGCLSGRTGHQRRGGGQLRCGL